MDVWIHASNENRGTLSRHRGPARKRHAEELRRHERRALVLDVVVDHPCASSVCRSRDMSPGGLFLDGGSIADLHVGEALRLALLVPGPDGLAQWRLSGVIVRRDAAGVAVRFEDGPVPLPDELPAPPDAGWGANPDLAGRPAA